MVLGRIYLLLEDYEATVKCYQQTEKYFSDLSLNLQAYFLNNYGNYYYYTKDYCWKNTTSMKPSVCISASSIWQMSI